MALPALFCLLLCLPAVSRDKSQDIQRTLKLEIAADRAPVRSGSSLVLFASDGTYQILEGESAGPVQSLPAPLGSIPPLNGVNGAWVLDAEGTLWKVSPGTAEPVERQLQEITGMAPGEPSPVLLTRDKLRLPSGETASLPFQGQSVTALGGEGFWIVGEGRALFMDPEGNERWVWDPEDLQPAPACLDGERLYAGTEEGCLVALDRETGREKYRFPTGAAIVSPPAVVGGEVVFASRDHMVRALDPSAGRLLWQARLRGRPDFGPYGVEGGTLFAEAAGDRLLLLTPEDGKIAWSWKVPEGAILVPPLLRGSEAALLAWGEGATPVLHLVAVAPTDEEKEPNEPKRE